jgi:hypothetical protein
MPGYGKSCSLGTPAHDAVLFGIRALLDPCQELCLPCARKTRSGAAAFPVKRTRKPCFVVARGPFRSEICPPDRCSGTLHPSPGVFAGPSRGSRRPSCDPCPQTRHSMPSQPLADGGWLRQRLGTKVSYFRGLWRRGSPKSVYHHGLKCLYLMGITFLDAAICAAKCAAKSGKDRGPAKFG